MSDDNMGSAPSERDVLVSIPTHDDAGRPITDDMLSTGGARSGGPFVKQYRNPRPVPSEPTLSAEAPGRESRLERETRVHEAREARLREEARAKSKADDQEFARWVYHEVLTPLGKWWWASRGPEDLARAQAFAVRQFHRVTAKRITVSKPEADTPAEAPELHVVDDAPAAPVLDLDDYRRPA